ncbi:MAG: hypothetical protein J6T27_04635, partial [Alphaproteobacteria bacterium]|nr:hypothetical protein [Alphaproteobacteria bacterium]
APQEIFHCETMKNINVCDAGAHIRSHWIPAFAGMTAKICGMTAIIIAALFAMPAFADPTAQELLDQKTVTSKYYVDTTKQDKITTDKVLAVDNDGNDDVYVPAIVTTNAAGTELSGDSIGVLSLETFDTVGLNLDDFYEREDLVPTVAALAPAFNGVYDEIYTKQGLIPAGTDGNVVTYTGVEGEVGSVATANAPTYDSQTGALSNGTNIATIAAVDTRQEKMTCAGYLAGHENDEDYCWLYSVASVTTQCLAYNETATSASQCCSGYLQSGTNLCGCNDISDCPSGQGYNNCGSVDHACHTGKAY